MRGEGVRCWGGSNLKPLCNVFRDRSLNGGRNKNVALFEHEILPFVRLRTGEARNSSAIFLNPTKSIKMIMKD